MHKAPLGTVISVPAYAGVILEAEREAYVGEQCSRVCGGDPVLELFAPDGQAVFPRMRG